MNKNNKKQSGTRSLYELIRALTPSEKRYFKLYISRNAIKDGSNYLKLFSLIEKQQEHDEAIIREQIKNTSLSGQLAVTKHYLYHHILKSLEFFNYQKGVDKKLHSLKNQIEILFEKSLCEQAKKLLGNAMLLAEKNEKNSQLIELSLWQVRILMKQYELKDLEKQLSEIYDTIHQAVDRISALTTLNRLDNQMVILIKKAGITRNKFDVKKFKSIIKNLLMKKEALASFWEKYFYHHIMSLYCYSAEDDKNSYLHRKALLNNFEHSPHFIEDNMAEYITALNNYILVCQQLNKRKEYNSSLEKMRRLHPASYEDQVKIFTNSYTLELLDLYNRGLFDKAAQLAGTIEKQLAQYDNKIDLSNRVMFCFILSASFLSIGDYNQALRFNLKLINTPRAEEIQDLYRFARILALLIHYEIGNDRVLDSQVKITQRYLKGKKKLFKMESLILELLAHLNKSNTTEQRNFLFKTFIKKLDLISKNIYEKKAFSYFDFMLWAKSKLAGRSMLQTGHKK